ncbi:hypothetical protein HOLleu_01315 [Holothuria leucospilota]|uniref:Integrase catalytic domain-containing protein n=1 Tax=Holothuria leucospilota TaxID=206669 RepID=A0A9Q1HKS4_HOLLE|nr:hypothetical protein HOLleu_01315 [Holothuria leucospilota]
MDKYLSDLYYDPSHPAGFGGVAAIKRAAKKDNKNISVKEIKTWLQSRDAYTLHKPLRRTFRRNKVIVSGIDSQWQADLVDISSFSKQNKNHRYILTCIHIFSKFAWARALKDKSGKTIVRAFQSIIKAHNRKPQTLQTDKGKEFVNRPFQQFLRAHHIHFFTTNNETKASVVERFNRTLKTKMWRYFTANGTRTYIDVLQKFLVGYNRRKHSSIGMAPVNVNRRNQEQVWQRLYGNISKSSVPAFKFNLGDAVQISMATQPFQKGYLPQWTEEVFTIAEREPRLHPVYRLKDFGGDDIVEPHAVGHAKVPLIRVVTVKGKYGEDTITGKGQWIEYHPIANITDSGPIEFYVSGSSEEYIDLPQTQLYVRAKITLSNGDELPAGSKVGPANLFLQSLFSQVDVSLNERLISPSTPTYPYRAMIETLLSYGSDAKQTQLTSSLFYKDTAGSMDNPDPLAADDAVNQGLKTRAAFTRRSKTVDMLGPIHSDIFFQDKYSLNGVSMKLKLIRSKDQFCLMSADTDVEYKVVIQDASLFVRKIKLNPAVPLAHARALEKATAKYPIRRVRLIVSCVTNTGFNGSYVENPFNFQHFNANFLAVYLDGEQIPYKPLKPNFDPNSGGNYIRAYHTLFSGTDKMNHDEGNAINREEYAKGYTLYAFDLAPDLSSGDHYNLVKQGNLRMELQFQRPLTTTVNVVVYAELDNLIEIDKARVFPPDTLRELQPNYPCSLVINLDPSHLPGSHWVAVFISKEKHGEYFDSYGLPPSTLSSIHTFMNRACLQHDYNERTLQGLFSNVYGHYVIFFCCTKIEVGRWKL